MQLFNREKLKQLVTGVNSSAQSFLVVQEGDYFALECGVGRLKKGLCRHLHNLVTQQQVRIKAFVSTNVLNTVLERWRDRKVDADINIYGAREDAKEIGKVLSKSSIFLQRPEHGLDGVEYYNPHFLRIEGYPEFLSMEPHTPMTNDRHKRPAKDIDSILNSLEHHTVGPGITKIRGIKSTLLQ